MCSSKFKALLLALALALPLAVKAQSQTSVTGTVIGSDGIPWVGGSITATIVSAGGGSFTLTPCHSTAGCPVAPTTSPTGISNGGSYSMSPWRNGSILPAGTTYTFTATINGLIPPVGTGPQTCTVSGVTLSSASQTVNLANCPPLTNISGFVGPVLPITNFGGKGDGRYCGVSTSSNTTIVGHPIAGIPSCTFTPKDVGKIIWVMGGVTLPSALICGSETIPETVAAFVSSTTVTLQNACNATVIQNTAYIGSDNWTAIHNGCQAIAAGGVLYFPAGNYMFGRFTITNQVTCALSQSAPFAILGPGKDITTLFSAPWVYTGNGALNGEIFNFSGAPTAYLSGWTLNGTDFQSTLPSGEAEINSGCSEIDGLAIVNFSGPNAESELQYTACTFQPSGFLPGVASATPHVSNSYLCTSGRNSALSFSFNQIGTALFQNNVYCGQPPTISINDDGAAVLLIGGTVLAESASNGSPILNLTGSGFVDLNGMLICSNGINADDVSNAGTGLTVNIRNTFLDNVAECPTAGADFSNIDVASGNTVNLATSSLTANGTGFNFNLASGGAAFDLGANKVMGGAGILTGAGALFQSNSITGTIQTAANITPSAGWGAGSAVSAVSGDSHAEAFTITAAGTPTANPTIAIVFPTPYWQAPHCQAIQIGGTGIIADVTQSTLPTTTGLTLTWQGTPAAASTYIFSLSCQ